MFVPHNTIYEHTGAGKRKSLKNHAFCGRGKTEFRQERHIWAYVGGAKGVIRNHTLCGRGQTLSFRKQAIYGHASVGKGSLSETIYALCRGKTGSSSSYATYGYMWEREREEFQQPRPVLVKQDRLCIAGQPVSLRDVP